MMKELRIIVPAILPAGARQLGHDAMSALEQALRRKDSCSDCRVTILAVGDENASEAVLDGLFRGADDGFVLSDRLLDGADGSAVPYAIAMAIRHIGIPDIILGGSQRNSGSDSPGRSVSEQLGLPYQDCSEAGETVCRPCNARFIMSRKRHRIPIMSLADISADVGKFSRAVAADSAGGGDCMLSGEPEKFGDGESDIRALVEKLFDHIPQMPAASHSPATAPVVVAGGYGMGSRENFAMLYELAELLHGEVGASRAAIDAGFAEHDRMIGQTGLTVRPKLYIACGISGQVQHVSGMRESGLTVSVNSDPDAPFNAIADYVVTGRVEDVLPMIIAQCKQKTRS